VLSVLKKEDWRGWMNFYLLKPKSKAVLVAVEDGSWRRGRGLFSQMIGEP